MISTDRSDEDLEAAIEVGREALRTWFGLSYASWLTIPRVVMEQMSDEWQGKMAALLKEYANEAKHQPDVGTRVLITRNGKLVKTPEWVINYRYPDKHALRTLFGGLTPREREIKRFRQ